MTKPDSQTLGVRVEKETLELIRAQLPPFCTLSEQVREILRDWAKKHCKNNSK